MWMWLSSPCRALSPAGWQFIQRGLINTLYTCKNACADSTLSVLTALCFISSFTIVFLLLYDDAVIIITERIIAITVIVFTGKKKRALFSECCFINEMS